MDDCFENFALNKRCSPEYAVTFGAWAGQTSNESLGNSVDSSGIAFQSWRRFKEAFSPRIVEKAISESELRVDTVFDPFCGSGTTPLAAQFLGAKGVAVEVNPYLADLAEAKLSTYNTLEVIKFKNLVRQVVDSKPHYFEDLFQNAPRTFVEPGEEGRYIFNKAVARRICQYRAAIEGIPNPEIKRLFRVLLGSTVIPVSNVIVSGKGRRYRQSWADRPNDQVCVDKSFSFYVDRAILDISRFQNRASLEFEIYRGDVREIGNCVGEYDLVVTSPPYPNSFDYTDVYNVELWALGYLNSREENSALRNKTLRSHVQIKRDFSYPMIQSPLLLATLERLEAIKERLWNKHIPSMIAAYFEDMRIVLTDIKRSLRVGGRVYVIVGDSRYSGINIPVAAILSEVACSIGYKQIAQDQVRSMRASPQQGGQTDLAETLLILRSD